MWARVLSFVFHPLFVPTYFFVFLSWVLPVMLEPISFALQPKFLLFFFLVTTGVPLLNIAVFRWFGTVRTFSMVDRRERLWPFVFVAVLYLALTYMFVSQGMMSLNDNFLRLIIVIDMLVVVGTILTFFFKVSLHSLCIWGLVGIMVPLNKLTGVTSLFYAAVALILLAGFVMSARLKMGSHSLREVMWGAVAGLTTGTLGMLLLF
jgi:hypothetical protein